MSNKKFRRRGKNRKKQTKEKMIKQKFLMNQRNDYRKNKSVHNKGGKK